MIRFLEHTDNNYRYLSIEGHADYSDGFDKVCGMVSVLAQSALYGVETYSKAFDVVIGSGVLKFKCPKEDNVGVSIMNSCIEGIYQVKEQFPQCFE